MKIRVKKRNLIAFSLILTFTLISIATVVYAQGLTLKSNFKVELAISNRNPNISINNISIPNIDPVDGGTVNILISFNVTDPDGVTTINGSSAVVNITHGSSAGAGGQWRSNVSALTTSEFGTCGNHTETVQGVARMVINCTVVMKYYDNATVWAVNISIKDTSGGTAVNDTESFTYNELSAISLPNTFINFSDVNVGQNNVKATPALIINNTGNDDFDMINISAAPLVGTTDSGQTIAVEKFGVNLTNSATDKRQTFESNGEALNLKARTTEGAGNATLKHGHSSALTDYNDASLAVVGNLSVTVWVDVPSSLTSQLYNATWNITVIDNP